MICPRCLIEVAHSKTRHIGAGHVGSRHLVYRGLLYLALVLFMFLTLPSQLLSQSRSIPVANPDFSNPVVGRYSDNKIDNWIGTGSSSLSYGVIVGYVNVPGQVGYAQEGAIYQTLSEPLQPNTQYRLSLLLGYSDGGPASNGKVQLLAGQSVLTNASATAGGYYMSQVTLNYTAPPNDPNLGQPLQIRVLDLDPIHTTSVYCDKITLTATTNLCDLAVGTLTWNTFQGGVDFTFSVQGGSLNLATTAKLFWANGTTAANILSNTPIFTHNIPAGFSGQSEIIHVPGSSLRNAPLGATHVLVLLDPDNSVFESIESNNLSSLRRDAFVLPVGIRFRNETSSPFTAFDLDGHASAVNIVEAFQSIGDRYVVEPSLMLHALTQQIEPGNWTQITDAINNVRTKMTPGDRFIFYIHTHCCPV